PSSRCTRGPSTRTPRSSRSRWRSRPERQRLMADDESKQDEVNEPDETAAEEPAAEEQPTAEEPAAEEQPAAEEPAEAQPAAEEPAEAPAAEEVVVEGDEVTTHEDVEDEEDEEEPAPRVKPEIPGAELEPDIVREGEEALRLDEEGYEDGEFTAEEAEELLPQ